MKKIKIPEFVNEVCEIKILYKNKKKYSEMQCICCSKDAVDCFRTVPEFNDNIEYKEMFYCLYTNRGGKVQAVCKISEGGISGTSVDVRLILQPALLMCSSGLILCHNHPSGNTQPSDADNRFCSKIKTAAETHGMSVLDNIVLTSDSFLSYADEGML